MRWFHHRILNVAVGILGHVYMRLPDLDIVCYPSRRDLSHSLASKEETKTCPRDRKSELIHSSRPVASENIQIATAGLDSTGEIDDHANHRHRHGPVSGISVRLDVFRINYISQAVDRRLQSTSQRCGPQLYFSRTWLFSRDSGECPHSAPHSQIRNIERSLIMF
jgi:hypothetical protein